MYRNQNKEKLDQKGLKKAKTNKRYLNFNNADQSSPHSGLHWHYSAKHRPSGPMSGSKAHNVALHIQRQMNKG